MPALRLIAAAVAAVLGGCGADGGGGRTIVASFYPLAFAAAELDPHADVLNLTRPGAEPHDLELTARDVERIRGADVVLYFGRGFQPAVEDAVVGATGETVDLLEGLGLAPAQEDSGDEGDDHTADPTDPHVWLDPIRYRAVVLRIGDTLGAPPARTAALARRLERLDRDYETGLARCTARSFVTSHAAFGYLAHRYGLEQVAISGLSPEAEPTPRELEHAVELVRELGATTIFFETLVSPRVAETVARETGARTAVLDPLEGLTDETLRTGGDYFSVMADNLDSLRAALRCR